MLPAFRTERSGNEEEVVRYRGQTPRSAERYVHKQSTVSPVWVRGHEHLWVETSTSARDTDRGDWSVLYTHFTGFLSLSCSASVKWNHYLGLDICSEGCCEIWSRLKVLPQRVEAFVHMGQITADVQTFTYPLCLYPTVCSRKGFSVLQTARVL